MRNRLCYQVRQILSEEEKEERERERGRDRERKRERLCVCVCIQGQFLLGSACHVEGDSPAENEFLVATLEIFSDPIDNTRQLMRCRCGKVRLRDTKM